MITFSYKSCHDCFVCQRVTEITFDGDDVVLHYSDHSSDTKDMSLVANGHQQPLPALANILDSYESRVVKVMGVE